MMRDSMGHINPEEENLVLELSDDDWFDLQLFEDDVFDIDRLVAESNNQRKTVRYVRSDINAFINQADIFGGYSLFKHSQAIEIKLVDISSKGALIASPKKLKMKKKVRLTLIFSDQNKFEIDAEVVRETPEARRFYGLRFEKMNHQLADHLLETQTKLIFK